MFGWLVSLFGGPIISSILNSVVGVYKDKLAAQNTTEAHAVDLAKAELLAEIEARKQATALMIAEQGRWYTAIIRPAFAFPLVIYVWKVVLWDKVFGWGSTDVIAGPVGEWAGWILAAYFVTRPIEKVARSILARR